MQPNASDSVSTAQSHVSDVRATSSGLVKATLGAAVIAGAILTFVVLPAEYGIDPTGVGQVLGLTEMGKIKEQLQAEANADAAVSGVPSNLEVFKRLDAMQAQLDSISLTVDALSTTSTSQTTDIQSKNSAPTEDWHDEFEYTLSPGEGIEVKLVMEKGATALYEWHANGSVLNHDTHGDGNGQNISYEQGRSVSDNAGQLTAAFTGNHGWFWRNRTEDPVLVTLRTRGDYRAMLLP